ncbi:unnamed protein product [Phytophthora fragariaefolia]|uniref:Unnamed protein product n=1 Tax=Phytophthora fragariaefolia TaxID=1490495 RepID=A0A9W7DCC5_9STRA|nr:unnamed protein product [Phytophthora fragariaefolia]
MRIFGCKAYVLTPKEKRLKWDPKAREGIFLGYEERSKAYRVYDIEAGQVVISRDVTFDESSFNGSKGIDDEDVDGVTDYFDDMQVSDDSGTRVFTQAGKRKSRAEHEDRDNVRRPRRTAGLEEASAPGHSDEETHRESSSPQEEKAEDNDEDSSTSPMFWCASANAVEASDSAEPKTFPEAVNGPDQVHWRKAIRAEPKSMRLRGVFRAAKLPNNQRAVGSARRERLRAEVWDRLHRDVFAGGQVRHAANDHRDRQVLRMADRPARRGDCVPGRLDEGEGVLQCA